MPSSTKSKHPPQSTTLHAFFSSASSSCPVASRRSKKSAGSSPGKRAAPLEHEIIVIDDDEDTENSKPYSIIPTKKRKLSSCDTQCDIAISHSIVKKSRSPSTHLEQIPNNRRPCETVQAIVLDSAVVTTFSSEPSSSTNLACDEWQPVPSPPSEREDPIEIYDGEEWGCDYEEINAASDSVEDNEPVDEDPDPATSMDGRNTNAFSLIMSGNKDREVWQEASAAEVKIYGRLPLGDRRQAPFYKVLQGFPIAVDAFKYGSIPGVNAYFLTHAHSDHYTHLSSKWNHGPIYCSVETAELIVHMLKVDRKWVHPLPLNIATVVPGSNGVEVTLIEANHCPGSCLFLFEGTQTVHAGDSSFKSPFVGTKRIFRYLHCGDFRASPQHVRHPAIHGKKLDIIYLDTTYLDPRYTFPSQAEVISACAMLAKKMAHGIQTNKISTMESFFSKIAKLPCPARKGENILFIIGTYSIGKERIVKAIASSLHTKVYCNARKTAILHCLDDPELHDMLTDDPLEANVHLVPLGVVTSDQLKPYMERYKGHFTKIVGFRPTGWTYSQPTGSNTSSSVSTVISKCQQHTFTCADLRPARKSTERIQLFGVPYSEHSSFFELCCFALSLRWDKIIATVNVSSENSRNKMKQWIEKWEVEKRKLGSEYIVPQRAVDYW